MTRPGWWTVGLALAAAVATGLAARDLGPGPVRLEMGGFAAGRLQGEWSRARAMHVDARSTDDGRTSFFAREVPPVGGIRLPLRVVGDRLEARIRLRASVRCSLDVFAGGARLGSVTTRPFRWETTTLEVPTAGLRGKPIALGLTVVAEPLVRGAHVKPPELLVDYLDLASPGGLRLDARSSLLAAAVPLALFVFALLVGAGETPALGIAAAGGALAALLARAAPLAVSAALPRLLPLALLTGLLAYGLLAWRSGLGPEDRRRLAGLVVAGVLAHGSVVFFPTHNPPDIDIHARRTLDLARVPLEYHAVLRYGSQLPTPSQDHGQATESLGSHTLIPYSPLPYLFFFAAHLLGLDLYWALTGLGAALAMLVAPWLFVVAERLFGRSSAWLATLLYVLDLAVWHHLGRGHAPAVFGSALGTAALLYLALRAPVVNSPRRSALAGLVLGMAVLGYSSLVVLVGLFGIALLVLLLLDARGLTVAARKGLAGALVVGGLLAGGLFYFHYLPGLVRGAGAVAAAPDRFPGRTFFIFHNESKESLRIWVLGYWMPLLAGLAAAPFAFRRLARGVRPVLGAWLLAWAFMMLLKEPFLFPRLLRWGKEDQFLSPLLDLLMAGAVGGLSRRSLRIGLGALLVAAALLIEVRDFLLHAHSLRIELL